MKQVAGFWLPDGEVDLVPFLESSPRFFKGPTYQVDKFLGCLPYIKRFRSAVDVGAHCGLWSRVLVKCFRDLYAFEPLQENWDCFLMNVEGANLHRVALGNQSYRVSMSFNSTASGNSHVDPNGKTSVQAEPLDWFGFEDVDFVKIDCEGFEYYVLQGGEDTIRRYKPCILVEQKQGMGAKYGLQDLSGVGLLKSWGAKLRFQMSGDYCLSWD